MKTAIPIWDEVFEAAERTAQVLGLSRSQLYTRAVSEFVGRHRKEGEMRALPHASMQYTMTMARPRACTPR